MPLLTMCSFLSSQVTHKKECAMCPPIFLSSWFVAFISEKVPLLFKLTWNATFPVFSTVPWKTWPCLLSESKGAFYSVVLESSVFHARARELSWRKNCFWLLFKYVCLSPGRVPHMERQFLNFLEFIWFTLKRIYHMEITQYIFLIWKLKMYFNNFFNKHLRNAFCVLAPVLGNNMHSFI